MTAKKQKPWSQWHVVRELGSGGQGTTFLAIDPRAGPDPAPRALKILKQQKDRERRERMRREVLALQALRHPGIPAVLEHNMQHAGDLETPLFFVAEYVDGETLESLVVRQGPLSFVRAVTFADSLLKTVAACHAMGTVHRDIKPENLIVTPDGGCSVLDFGLSYNASIALDDAATATMQQVGNRFLQLPEHAAGSDGKRDPRSDVTQCAGVLFYCLTGIRPSQLRDHNDEVPHQRAAARAALARIAVLPAMLAAFDKAFAFKPEDRFADANELLAAIVMPSVATAHADAVILSALKQRAANATGTVGMAIIDAAAAEFDHTISGIFHELVAELESTDYYVHEPTIAHESASATLFCHAQLISRLTWWPIHFMNVYGVVAGRDVSVSCEVLDWPDGEKFLVERRVVARVHRASGGLRDWDEARRLLRRFVLETLHTHGRPYSFMNGPSKSSPPPRRRPLALKS